LHTSMTANDLALLTNFFDAWAYFHVDLT
jgi:hypothetical protein